MFAAVALIGMIAASQAEEADPWVTLHLRTTLDTLRATQPPDLSAAQRASRAQLIASLAEYVDAENYPHSANVLGPAPRRSVPGRMAYAPERAPVFVDDSGRLCAAGYLLASSGRADLVDAIRATSNYELIDEMEVEGLTDWVERSGLSLDELARIQPTYGPTTPPFTGTCDVASLRPYGRILPEYYDCLERTIGDLEDGDDLATAVYLLLDYRWYGDRRPGEAERYVISLIETHDPRWVMLAAIYLYTETGRPRFSRREVIAHATAFIDASQTLERWRRLESSQDFANLVALHDARLRAARKKNPPANQKTMHRYLCEMHALFAEHGARHPDVSPGRTLLELECEEEQVER